MEKTAEQIVKEYFPSGFSNDPEQSKVTEHFVKKAMEEYAAQFHKQETAELLVCDHPQDALIRDKPTLFCLACNKNIGDAAVQDTQEKPDSKIVYFIEHKETHLWWYSEEDKTRPNTISTFGGSTIRSPSFGYMRKDCWTNNPNDERIAYKTREEAQKMIDTEVGVFPDSVEITEHEFVGKPE